MRDKKRRADEKFGESLTASFRENKKKFWREVNRVTKTKEQLEMRVKNERGEVVTEKDEVLRVWTNYFDRLLNVDDGREADLTGVIGVGVNGSEVEVEVNEEEVRNAVKRLKNGKSPGVDDIMSEMLKGGDRSVVEWLPESVKHAWTKEGCLKIGKELVWCHCIFFYRNKTWHGQIKTIRV